MPKYSQVKDRKKKVEDSLVWHLKIAVRYHLNSKITH